MADTIKKIKKLMSKKFGSFLVKKKFNHEMLIIW